MSRLRLALPAGVTEVSLLGEKLTIERLDGTEVVTAPGRPIAVVSQVQVEYRPPPHPALAAAPDTGQATASRRDRVVFVCLMRDLLQHPYEH